MKRKITREIFVEIETVRVTKKRAAQKKTSEPAKPDISAEICRGGAGSFARNGEHLVKLIDQHF
jgi:hypothetical protein